MEEVDTQLYRGLLKEGTQYQRTLDEAPPRSIQIRWKEHEPTLPQSGTFDNATPRSNPFMLQEHETRDDRERNASSRLPQQLHAFSDEAMVSSPVEGIIQVEILRESIPGITFSRRSSSGTRNSYRYPLQIDYIHADSSFYRSPLVPGLVVREINGQKMIHQSPQDAQRELVNNRSPRTTIQVSGYIGKTHKSDKSTRLGLVLKDSSTADGVYISAIKHDSLFWGTGLKAGLKVISINKRPCPQDILKAIKRLQRITGALEIVAVDTSGLDEEYITQSARETNPWPPTIALDTSGRDGAYAKKSDREIISRPFAVTFETSDHRDRSGLKLEREIQPPLLSTLPPKEVFHINNDLPPFHSRDKAPQGAKDEPIHIISLLHIEEPPLPQNFEITDQKQPVDEPPRPEDYEIEDKNSLLPTVNDEDSSCGSTASGTTFTGANTYDGPVAQKPNSKTTAQHKYTGATRERWGAPDPEDILPIKLCEEGPLICSAFLEEVTEFIKEHSAALNNAVRKVLGDERAELLFGEKECSPWRLVDVRQYSQVQSMPSIVVESVDQPTPPMILGLEPSRSFSSVFDNGKKASLVGVAVPQELLSSHRNASLRKGKPWAVGKDPGLIVTGLEMNFTEKAVFIAKDTKRVKEGDNIVMAVLLYADNALLQMDKMCFS